MKQSLFFFALFFFHFSQSQETQKNKWDIAISYGPGYSFFVDYGRPMVRDGSNIVPPLGVFGYDLFQKNYIGTFGGIEINYRLTEKSSLGLVYERQQNIGKFDINVRLDNGTPIFVKDMKLRNLNVFYSLQYRRSIDKNSKWFATLGLFLIKENQAEIEINPYANTVEITERNAKNSGLEDLGAYAGLEYFFYKNGDFEFGIQTKLYYNISIGGDMESFAITPKLKFNF